jgi:hypothetical protein
MPPPLPFPLLPFPLLPLPLPELPLEGALLDGGAVVGRGEGEALVDAGAGDLVAACGSLDRTEMTEPLRTSPVGLMAVTVALGSVDPDSETVKPCDERSLRTSPSRRPM